MDRNGGTYERICGIWTLNFPPYAIISRCSSWNKGEEGRPLLGSLKMNTALEYSTRVVQEGGRRCKKSTLNDLVLLTPLRIPSMNPPHVFLLPFTVNWGASTKRPLLRTSLPYITVLVCVIPCIIYSWTKYSLWGNGSGFHSVYNLPEHNVPVFSSLMYIEIQGKVKPGIFCLKSIVDQGWIHLGMI